MKYNMVVIDPIVKGFIIDQEGFETKTYLPVRDGSVIGQSGVTFGVGIDVGQMDVKEFMDLGLPPKYESALLPFVGKKGEYAAKLFREMGAIEIPAEIAMAVSERVIAKSLNDIAKKHKGFIDLPPQAQAVILSLVHNYGHSALEFQTVKAIMKEDYATAITKLRNHTPEEWKNRELWPRRGREADLLEGLVRQQQQQSLAMPAAGGVPVFNQG
jgi:hypothetical protein